MNPIKIFSVIGRIFKRIFSPKTAQLLHDGLAAAEPYLADVYEMVRLVSALTPTRADDEILRAADALGVPALLAAQPADRSGQLAGIVIRAAKNRWPDASERVIRRAIEIAIGAVKP